jgi:hypothetical protein
MMVEREKQTNFWFRDVVGERMKTEKDVLYVYDRQGRYDAASPTNARINLGRGFAFAIMIVGALLYTGRI